MNFPEIVFAFPANCTDDLHICGVCKAQFTILEAFLQHKLNDCNNLCVSQDGKLDAQCRYRNERELNNATSNNAHGKTVIVKNDPFVLKLIKNANKNQEDLVNAAPFLKEENTSSGHCLLEIGKKSSIEMKNSKHCSASFSRKHMESVRGPERGGKLRLSCNESGCKFSCLVRKDMERHRRIHTGEKPFRCTQCFKNFTRNDKLQIHLRIHSGDKRYKCSQCNYAAVESSSLVKHQRIHTGRRPFKCQLCCYSAREKCQLTVHLRMHTGDAPYVCSEEKCKAAFKTSSDLKRHVAGVHATAKHHACLFCPYQSSLRARLALHMRKQHPNEEDGINKPFKCPNSPQNTFSTARKLNNHIKTKHTPYTHQRPQTSKKRHKIMTGDNCPKGSKIRRDHECTDCHAMFVCPDSLRVHMLQHGKGKRLEAETKNSNVEELDGGNYLENGELRTAEMLASFAEHMRYSDVSGFFGSDDGPDGQDSIKFVESALL